MYCSSVCSALLCSTLFVRGFRGVPLPGRTSLPEVNMPKQEPPLREAILKKSKDNAPKMEAQIAKDVVPFNFLTPMRIIRDAIFGVGSPAPVVVSEGANTMDVGRAVLVQTEHRTRLDAGTWGTIGVVLGYCIATVVACPD